MQGAAGGTESTPSDAEVGTVVDAATRSKLMFPFVAIQFKPEDEVRLADFCSFLSEAIDLPITLDIDALLSAGLSSEAFVECDLRGVTAQQALTTVLERLGVTFTVEAAGIVIGVAEAREFTTRNYDVADLVEDEAQLAVLSGWITSLVAPPSWDTQGGDGTVTADEHKLEVYQTGVTHYRLARFLDRLRTARGLLPRSDLPPDEIVLAPAFIQMAENLNLTTAASFPRPTPLRDVLNHLQGETDLRMLPDWHAMLALGVTPTLELSPGLAEQPLHELLKELLPALNLEYRAVDASTLQISAQAALEARVDVELYPILNAADLDERKLIAQLHELVGAPYFTPTGGTGAMAYDKVSQCLMVSLPQPQQRLVATWLVTNRQTDFGLGAAR